MRLRRLALALLPALTALSLAAGSAGSNTPTRVQITFTAAGGGRYLDVTRWLRDDTRDCYARRTADETVSVAWKLGWKASVVRTANGLGLRALVPLRPAVKGSIEGKTVRDGCDVADQELDQNWIGSD